MADNQTPIVYTLTAKCRDCYRCLRVCPVGAIGVREGQAFVDDGRCIQCGTCVRECPQHAKTYRDDIDDVKALLRSGARVAVSLAPSFVSVFKEWEISRLPSALRQLGFTHIGETAEGARLIAQKSAAMLKSQSCNSHCGMSTSCPAVVHFIEKYHPERVEGLAPVVSPMIAHGRMMKEKLGDDTRVVFIGPCVAKKKESERPEYAGVIDAVLTFDELTRWLDTEEIDLRKCEESGYLRCGYMGQARLFPLPGGLLKTADILYDGTQAQDIPVSGPREIKELLNLSEERWPKGMVELLFCPQGCINGPGMGDSTNLYERRERVIAHTARQIPEDTPAAEGPDIDLTAVFGTETPPAIQEAAAAQIEKVYEQTGKTDPALRLDCGACGYPSCEAMARAVIAGMAEPQMCMPHMRRLAERRTDRIIETSPNGIVILDEDLCIIEMNPAFRKYFMCTDSLMGRKVSYLFDAAGFEKLASGAADTYESVLSYNGSDFHQLLYRLPGERQYVGIYVDITRIQVSERNMNVIKLKTIQQARELLDHQIRMAQNMASFLGESTAKGEELVERLMSIYEQDD